MHRAPLALVDESPDVSRALESLVAACNEMGVLVCEISRHVSSSEGGDASSSATDDEEPKPLRAEPKSDVHEAVAQKKKAANETLGRFRQSVVDTCGPAAGSAAVIDLSLSDDAKVVKDEPRVKEERKHSPKAAAATATGGQVEPRRLKAATKAATGRVEYSAEMNEPRDGSVSGGNGEVDAPVAPMEEEDSESEVIDPPRRRSQRKRKALRQVEPPTVKRPGSAAGEASGNGPKWPRGRRCPLGTKGCLAVEDSPTATEMDASISAFVAATTDAGKKLVQVHAQHPAQAERHLEDMRLLMSVAVVSLERELTSEQVLMAWKLTAALKRLHRIYPVKTKGLHRYEVSLVGGRSGALAWQLTLCRF